MLNYGMDKFLFLLAVLLGVYVSAKPPTRIIGGHPVKIEEYPYHVSILYGNSRWCGGVLLSSNYVLSAAHCFQTTKNFRVRAGSTHPLHGGQVVDVLEIMLHPKYNDDVIDYDMAILALSKPFELSNVIKPVKLPIFSKKVPVQMGVATGWTSRITKKSRLMAVELPVYEHKDCVAMFDGNISPRMFCAGGEGGKDACQGDSGGPFTIKGTLYGLTSWGRGCARAGEPGVYTNVPVLRKFISKHTGL